MTQVHAGIFPSMSESEYHADPAPEPSLSSSIAKLLLDRSPLHAWTAHPRLNPAREPIENAAFDLGKVAHRLILGKGGEFRILHHDSYSTKAAREERDAARAEGVTPILAEQYDRAAAMCKAVDRQLARHEDTLFLNDSREQIETSVLWRDGGIWCRCRPDWMPGELVHSSVVYDLKTTATSARPEVFGTRQLWSMGYDLQAAWYLRGIKAVTGAECRFRFVVVEVDPPHALSVIELPPETLELAAHRCEQAIRLWKWCLSEDRWPGYSQRIEYAQMPTWLEYQRAEISAGNETRMEDLEAAMKMQRPIEEIA